MAQDGGSVCGPTLQSLFSTRCLLIFSFLLKRNQLEHIAI